MAVSGYRASCLVITRARCRKRWRISSPGYALELSSLAKTYGLDSRTSRCTLTHCLTARTGELCLGRSEEHTSELQSLMRISYAVFCLKQKTSNKNTKLEPQSY